MRQQRFTVNIPAYMLPDAPSDELGDTQVILQGAIDCCFEEDGQWVLVDYKTDSPSELSARIEKHRPQLEIYAQALERITRIPVREKVLYFVRAGAFYVV